MRPLPFTFFIQLNILGIFCRRQNVDFRFNFFVLLDLLNMYFLISIVRPLIGINLIEFLVYLLLDCIRQIKYE